MVIEVAQYPAPILDLYLGPSVITVKQTSSPGSLRGSSRVVARAGRGHDFGEEITQ